MVHLGSLAMRQQSVIKCSNLFLYENHCVMIRNQVIIYFSFMEMNLIVKRVALHTTIISEPKPLIIELPISDVS